MSPSMGRSARCRDVVGPVTPSWVDSVRTAGDGFGNPLLELLVDESGGRRGQLAGVELDYALAGEATELRIAQPS